jgi:hypothetical protein
MFDSLLSSVYGDSGYNAQYLYCGGGASGWYNFWDCSANLAQDASVIVNAPFASLEFVLIALACAGGACSVGVGVGQVIFNVTGGNALESTLSGYSSIASILADATDEDGTIGEDTFVALATGIGGALSPDPILDYGIDLYGSGYNHETFPGPVTWFLSITGQ